MYSETFVVGTDVIKSTGILTKLSFCRDTKQRQLTGAFTLPKVGRAARKRRVKVQKAHGTPYSSASCCYQSSPVL
jgi:hypothetical protein